MYLLRYITLYLVVMVVVLQEGFCISCSASETIAIKVVEASTNIPLPNATVSTGAYNLLPDHIVGKTNAQGTFVGTAGDFLTTYDLGTSEVRGVIEPSYIWVKAQGFVAQCIGSLPHNTSKTSPYIVKLIRGRMLRGRLLGQDGNALPNEHLLLVGKSHELPIQYATQTDKEGRFRWNEAPSGDIYVAFGVEMKESAKPEFQRLHDSTNEVDVRALSLKSQSRKPAPNVLYAVFQNRQAVLPLQLRMAAGVADAAMQQLGSSWNQGSTDGQLLSISADHRSVYLFDITKNTVRFSGKLELSKKEVDLTQKPNVEQAK